MAQDDKVEIEVGATTSDAEDKFQGLGDTIKDSMGKAGDSMSGLNAITVALGMVIANLAEEAFAKLKEALTESYQAFAHYGEEIGKMQRIIGGTTESLSTLDTALGAVGISAEKYEGIVQRVSLRMEKSAAAYEKFGISMKDANGQTKQTSVIISEIVDKLGEYEAGADRNKVATQLLGRSFISVSDLMKLTKDRMAEATSVAKDFGLVLTENDVKSAEDFSFSTTLMGEALHGIYITIGRELTPILTSMAEWFLGQGKTIFEIGSIAADGFSIALTACKEVVVALWDTLTTAFRAIGDVINAVFGSGGEGVTAMEFFRNTVTVLEIAIIGFRTGFIIALAAIQYALEQGASALKFYASIAVAAFHLDWAGVKTAWAKGIGDSSAAFKAMTDKMVKEAQTAHDQIAGLLNPTAKVGDTSPIAKPGKQAPPTAKKGAGGATSQPSNMADYKAELEQQLEAEKAYFKTSTDEEITFWTAKQAESAAFWADKLSKVKEGSKQYLAIEKSAHAESRAIDHELYMLRKTEAHQQLADDLEALKLQEAQAQAGGEERIKIATEIANRVGMAYGYEGKEYLAAVAEIEKAAKEHQKQMDKLADLHTARVAEAALNDIELEKAALAHKKDIGQISDVEELTALKDLLEKEYQLKYQAAQDDADRIHDDVVKQQEAYDKLAAMAEKHAVDMANASTGIAKAQADQIGKFLDPITQAFDTTVQGIIQGTTTIHDGFKNMCNSIVLEFNKMTVQLITNWIKTQLQLQMESGTGLGGWISSLMGAAGGSGGSAAIPALNTSTVDAGGVLNSVPSFDTGTNFVPHDMLAVIHRGEAVVPAQYNRGQSGQSSQVINNNFNVSGAVDLTTRQQLANMVAQTLSVARGRNG